MRWKLEPRPKCTDARAMVSADDIIPSCIQARFMTSQAPFNHDHAAAATTQPSAQRSHLPYL